MNNPLVIRTTFTGLSLLHWRNRPVLESQDLLQDLFAEASPLSLHVAEPVVRWPNGTQPGEISWYAPTEDGSVFQPFRDLPEPDQRRILDVLRSDIGKLAARAGDGARGTLIHCALTVPHIDAIRSDGQRILLAPWGACVPEIARIPDATAWNGSPIEQLLNGRDLSSAARAPRPAPDADTADNTARINSTVAADATIPQEKAVPSENVRTLPVSAISYRLSRPLPRVVAGLLHVVTFLFFFWLSFRAALALIVHTHAFTLPLWLHFIGTP